MVACAAPASCALTASQQSPPIGKMGTSLAPSPMLHVRYDDSDAPQLQGATVEAEDTPRDRLTVLPRAIMCNILRRLSPRQRAAAAGVNTRLAAACAYHGGASLQAADTHLRVEDSRPFVHAFVHSVGQP